MKQTYMNRIISIREKGFFMDTVQYDQVYDPMIGIGSLEINCNIEISFVVSGTGFHRVLNHVFPCQSGDIYILNEYIPHCYYAAEDSSALTIRRLTFSPKEWFNAKYASSSESDFLYGCFRESRIMAYAMLTQAVCENIGCVFDEIAAEFYERRSEWREAARARLTLLLITLARYANRAIKNVAEELPDIWNPIVGVIAFVHENYGDSCLTLESIADSFHLSRAHLSRQFKETTGETFSDFLQHVRLERARDMLVETEKTVKEIMVDCGMKDTTSFYRAFNKHFGMTPNHYRKQHIREKTKMSILREISENLQKGKGRMVTELVQKALDEGVDPHEILSKGLLDGMNTVGEKFRNNEVFVPDVLVSARAINKGITILKPHLIAEGAQTTGKVCIGTVQGDLHDIGKNLVKMMLEAKGLEVIDLGTDVSPETFVHTAIDKGCQVICCSALLTTTMGVMEDVVKKAVELGVRDQIKIMIGGAPVTEDFCKRIGADCYMPDAASAADAAVEFCK